MTDDTTTGGSEPTRDEAERLAKAARSEESGSEETHGAATEGEPLSESTEGGLEGGDPGVEE